jgi:hypothetical protein
VIGWADNENSWYQYAFEAPGFAPTGSIQYLDTRFDNGNGADTFPTSLLPGYMYGVPDIGYTVSATSTPEPFSLGLTGLGMAFLLLRRRRTQSVS